MAQDKTEWTLWATVEDYYIWAGETSQRQTVWRATPRYPIPPGDNGGYASLDRLRQVIESDRKRR